MTSLTFGNISLKHFVQRSKSAESGVVAQMYRQMQNGAFAMLWDQCDSSVVRVYATLGKVFGAVQAISERPHIVRQHLKRTPMCGLVRARTPHGDDFRFVALSHKNHIYIVLENAALDSNHTLLWCYEEDVEGFVECEGGKNLDVLDFLISEEVAVA